MHRRGKRKPVPNQTENSLNETLILFLLIKWRNFVKEMEEVLEKICLDDPKSVLFLLEAKLEGLPERP